MMPTPGTTHASNVLLRKPLANPLHWFDRILLHSLDRLWRHSLDSIRPDG